jgi:uncharacterized protein YbaR (Trm112 family)
MSATPAGAQPMDAQPDDHPVGDDLLAILACPSDDHAPLRRTGSARAGNAGLVCTYCGSAFPVRDGIPVLLMDDAQPGPNGLGHAADGAPPVDASSP